jgi:hypothetical protein
VQAATVSAPAANSRFCGTIPAGVAQVRDVLTGFSPLDTATRGSVSFDDVGLFAH